MIELSDDTDYYYCYIIKGPCSSLCDTIFVLPYLSPDILVIELHLHDWVPTHYSVHNNDIRKMCYLIIPSFG